MLAVLLAVVMAITATLIAAPAAPVAADDGLLLPGEVLRVPVPEAFGGKTVLGQLTVDRVTGRGFVTAYGCADGPPRNEDGEIARSDLNFNGAVSPVASNRLIVEADDAGDVCFVTHRPAALIVDVNATSFDTGITSIPNQRTDTRERPTGEQTITAGGVLRITVPDAAGGRTVVGQLTVDRANRRGFVTAYPCAEGLPRTTDGRIARSDLNVDGTISPVASNRLVVAADANGEICLFTQREVALIVDVNGITDAGIESFANTRIDTRVNRADEQVVPAGNLLRVEVPAATGGKTVLGQLTVDRAAERGFVTAYGCDDGLPRDGAGEIARSDLNVDGTIGPVASNRLVVAADDDGHICLFTQRAVALIVDVNAVSTDTAISAFPNRRTDTRDEAPAAGPVVPPDGGAPVWPPYEPASPLIGIAALTGEPADTSVTERPVLAVKIDNFGPARPQWGLDVADTIIELNVEGVTRFMALFHSTLPDRVGPVRSARTADLDLLAGMNRPVFGFSGANPGVTAWIANAFASGVLSDFTAQRNQCYERSPDRPGPHNLLLDPTCAVFTALDRATPPGAAQPLWSIDASWVPPAEVAITPATSFAVDMDGTDPLWTWTGQRYERGQDGAPHLAESGAVISADNVVVIRTEHPPSVVDGRSPNPLTVGTGAATVHRNGVAFDATWSRATPYDRFSFFDTTSGLPILLDRGTTFIHLARP
ncbi:MAG: DUF3048 domain-containing protein [Actinomycetota bacterium]